MQSEKTLLENLIKGLTIPKPKPTTETGDKSGSNSDNKIGNNSGSTPYDKDKKK